MGQLLVKIASIQAIPPQGTRKKHAENLQKCQQRLDEAPFKRLLKGWGFHNMKYYEVQIFITHILHQIINGR
jgi:ribosome-associated toxin RatA of RatAB toxin-antitoxin module